MQVRTLLLIVICCPVFSSAQWILLSESYLGNVYLDPQSYEKKEPYYFVWQLQDFKAEDRRGVKSRRILNKINCQTGERRILYSTSHSEHMGKGTVLLGGVVQSAWTDSLPKTVGAKLISEVCNHYYGIRKE